ncbi:MAG: cation:dicarboxylase symporter family transporter, partial [Clostridium sp.]
MNINLILSIILSMVGVFIIFIVNKKTGKFAYAVLTALILGLILGSIFKENIMFLEVFGKGYMSLIKMVVIPLVTTSLITSITRLKDMQSLKSIGLKSLA